MRAVWICAVAISLLPIATARADGDGLATSVDRVPWARFQTRLVASPDPGWRAGLAPVERSGLAGGGLRVLGDLYFGTASAARQPVPSGFRATSGLIIGARNSLWGGASTPGGPFGGDRRSLGVSAAPAIGQPDGPDSGTVPYVGVGYSSLTSKSGWRFSADLGLVSQSPGNAVRFGRVLGSSQNLDDVVRDMRLTPMIQLGVSYSF